jgi:NAD(P)-dependent dehydrogenase (short-subunit alcohol dehydrogenase family)
MSRQLDGKIALVTGASSGIGKATARLFLQEGACVAGLARSGDELQTAMNELSGNDDMTLSLTADISNAEQMERAVEQIIERWGQLDIVFANAGINGVWAPLEELDPEEWDRTIRINLTGTFLTVKYAVPYLKQHGGSVIITSSVNGTRIFSNTGATAYSCSKAGQVVLAKMIALELAEYDIRVNAICPGAIKTQIGKSTEKRDLESVREPARYPEGKIPLTGGRPGKPEDVAQLALFLASDAARLISGTQIWIDGTESLLMG